MRLVKLFLIVILASTIQLVRAQSIHTDEQPMAMDQRDPIKLVHIFPNPATEYLHVKLEHVAAAKAKITVHTIIGNEMPVETEIVDEHEIRIRVKDFVSGYYLLAVKDDDAKIRGTFKFLKR
jgi:hypothetical protein